MNSYLVEVPIKGKQTPEYVGCTNVVPDTEHQAKRIAADYVRGSGVTPMTVSRVLVLRDCDAEIIHRESIRQFLGRGVDPAIAQMAEDMVTR